MGAVGQQTGINKLGCALAGSSLHLRCAQFVLVCSGGYPAIQSHTSPSAPLAHEGQVDWLIWDENYSQTSAIYTVEIFRLW